MLLSSFLLRCDDVLLHSALLARGLGVFNALAVSVVLVETDAWVLILDEHRLCCRRGFLWDGCTVRERVDAFRADVLTNSTVSFSEP